MTSASALGLDRVDVVANDTGGAVAQVFAARYPRRMRTLTLTNCDVHDNFPPEAFKPFVALAESGEFGPMVAALAGDLAVARSEVGFGQGYAHPDRLTDELLMSYLAPFVPDQGKGLERLLTASSAAELMAVEPLLAQLHAPAQVAWGTGGRLLRAVVGRAPGRHDPRRRAGHPRARRHVVLARRAGSRPRPVAPGLLGGPRLIRRRRAGPEAASQLRALVASGSMAVGVMATDDCHQTYKALFAKGVTFLPEPAERPSALRR